ncbi:uncharacterized protein SPSC_04734 [Sporisorium scitamineum]|nr:uncharacterized protein SPSC_04734 [Sporisorium scitamineum]
MAIALIRALLEYAQLVLMLLTDPDAVELCYAQHCPVRQMKDELDRLVLAEGEKQREPPAPEPMSKDHISTNMLVTPSQRSESDPDPERDQQRQCDPPRSICACGEEDYLVTMEDDVRKPCIVKPEPNPGDHATKEVKAIPSKAESVIDPAEAFSKPAHEITAVAAPISDVQKEGDRHQWKDELLPAAEATPMDTF